MADPYHRYAAPPERDDSLGSRVRSDSGVRVTAWSSLYDPLEDTYRSQRHDIARSMMPGVYGVDAVSVSVHGEPGLTVTAGAGFPTPLQAQTLPNQRHEVGAGIGSSVSTDFSRERYVPSRSGDGLPVLKGESNILFVDGLPTDYTRREVGQFVDRKCALTAMEALQEPQVQDAANHVVKSLQQKSNSLFPYELQEIVHAKAEAMDSFEPYENGTNGSNGENGAKVENDANGENMADGKGVEHALPPPPPVNPPDVVPLHAQVDITPEPLKKKIVHLPIARRGLGTKGQKIPLLTNRFKSYYLNIYRQQL